MANRCLVLLDTDRIKEYIFAVSKLKEIRGASGLLDDLNLKRTAQIAEQFGAEKILLGGGIGKFWVDDRQNAEGFCNAVERLYAKATKVCSITTWIEQTKPDEGFRATLDRAEKQIRRKKDGKAVVTQFNMNPYMKYCELCGVYPAIDISAEKTHGWVCAACNVRRENSSRRIGLFDTLKRMYPGGVITEDSFPEDFGEVGEGYGAKGYIGFIYADGNGMGKMLQDLITEEQGNHNKLTSFSETVDTATKEGIVGAVLKHMPKRVHVKTENHGSREIFPVEFIIGGGDDLVLIVPATKALQIALTYCSNFESIFLERIGRENNDLRGTVACGVAIAKATYPIGLLFKLAGELLHSAKRHSKRGLLQAKDGESRSAIDFSVVTTSSTGHVEDIRDDELSYQSDGVVRLTERPYYPDQLKDLLDFASACNKAGLPKSKLQNMQQILHQGRGKASLEFLKMIGRFRNNELRQVFLNEMKNFKLIPWRQHRERFNTYTTPFLDLTEIYDFVTAGTEEE